MFTIYRITHILNRESYIGVTSRSKEERWKEHQQRAEKGVMTHLHCSIRKYGAGAFSVEILEEGLDPQIGKNIREPYWISVLKPEYNHTQGGDGATGTKHSIDANFAKSLRMAGNTRNMGKKRSEYTRSKTSESMKGKQNFLGHKHSIETKMKLSLARKEWCLKKQVR